ncbi:MAG: decarboxylating 6-phosphogluconate dehydrogenase [Dehalococcoidia bacterium]|nr:decarboxylating 6-phosphogluconate dehydrogenase [Dehalococcoidia bacterium]
MELGMIGLGRLGGNMVQRLLRGGHNVVAHDRSEEAVAGVASHGASAAGSLQEVVQKLAAPRSVWVMVPAGQPTESTIEALVPLLSPGDTILEGGNSNYKDSVRRAEQVARRSIDYLDVGTSGGIWGLAEGYCLMIGGPAEAFRRNESIFQTLAPAGDRGYVHVGPNGAGHYVKMVHNAIEYGLMEAYAEGFELMAAKSEFQLDLASIAETWRYGSVVRSWLLDLAAKALEEDPGLHNLQSYVEDSGEGRWAVEESVELAVPAPVITLSLQQRFRSRQDQPLGGKVLAALRNQFGGHAVKKSDD